MKKSLVLCLLLFHAFIACDHPASPPKKADIIHVEKITHDSNILALYPALQFTHGGLDRYEFYDERYLRFQDIPVRYMSFSMSDDQLHVSNIDIKLFKHKEDVKALKDKLTKAYGQPGGDSSNDFSTFDDEELLVWKDNHQLVGLFTEKNFETVAKITKEPTVHIVFVKPEEINN